ncbi:MAG: hypothetical protein H8M99_04500 [Gloeobacteraceae cyanobacterium ES-bin-144]|nr:hypothetical protein [Verrucomicrobiales bacterium]
MKSCFGLLFILAVFTVILGGGALIWYLSDTAEFSRASTSARPAATPGQPPVATPVRPPAKH